MIHQGIPTVQVLGTTSIEMKPWGTVQLSALKERRLLALLVLRCGSEVSTGQLIDALWPTKPPRTATVTLQGYIAQLWRRLEPDRAPRAEPAVLLTSGSGYVLKLPHAHVDAKAFDDEVTSVLIRWSSALAPPWPTVAAADTAAATTALDELTGSLGRWEGLAYSDLDDHPDVMVERVRLDELRHTALELAASLHLGLGEHVRAIGELEQLSRIHPLREGVTALHALALARSGRQSEALDVLQQLWIRLRDELGIDLSPMAQSLRAAILRQDPVFGLGPITAAPASPSLYARFSRGQRTVGRQGLLDLIRQTLLEVPRSGGRAVLLTGEVGIGKTRVAEEVTTMIEDLAWGMVEVTIPEDLETPSLWPIQQLLDQFQDQTGGSLMAAARGEAEDPDHFFYFQEFVATIRAASQRQPLLVMVHDLQRWDLHSLRAIRQLVDVLPRTQVALLLSQQDGMHQHDSHSGLRTALTRAGALRLEVPGLNAAEVRELALDSGIDLNSAEAEALRKRTGGNPMYVIDLARSGRPLDRSLPASLVAVIEDRVAQLGPDTLRTLRVAAVLGTAFGLSSLSLVLGVGCGPLRRVLAVGERLALVHRSGESAYEFRQELVREVLADQLTQQELAAIHQRLDGLPTRPDAPGDGTRFRVV